MSGMRLVAAFVGLCLCGVLALAPARVHAQATPAPGTSAPGTSAPGTPPTPAPTSEGASPATQPSAAAREKEKEAARATSEAAKERKRNLEEAVKVLVAEASELDVLEKSKTQPVWSRPHPALKAFGKDMAIECLQRMQQSFVTGGQGLDFKDTYVRWHLMHVVKQATQEDRAETGPRLVQLINMMPGALNVQGKTEVTYDPPEIASKYFGLANSGNMVVGYPPFQRVVGPPESYKYMDADKIAKIKANLEEAERLRKQFTTKVDPAAQQWNARVRQISYIVRQYRGELIYSLLLTGDPEMLRRVASEVDKQAKKKSGVAFDLVAYFYLAAFDGALNLYDQKVLNEVSNSLKASAIAMEGYMDWGGITRNFADYSFHLIYMLQDGGGFIDPKDLGEPETRGRTRRRS